MIFGPAASRLRLSRGLKDADFAGADVVAVAPQYDPTNQHSAGRGSVLIEILSLVTFCPSLA